MADNAISQCKFNALILGDLLVKESVCSDARWDIGYVYFANGITFKGLSARDIGSGYNTTKQLGG